MDINAIENKITETFTNIFRSSLFFLEPSYQSLFVSILHYAIFICGFYILFFYSKPRSLYRWLFFGFTLMAMIMYFIFNRCILTSVELNLCSKNNIVQKFISYYFGHGIEGNSSSKIVLTLSVFITGFILLYDYKVI